MNIVERIRQRCKEKKTSVSTLEKELGMGNGTIRGWNEKDPGAKKLLSVAEKLDCSISWLLTGKEETDEKLTPEEKELIKKYRKSNMAGKKMILEHAAIVQEQLPEDPLSSVTSASWREETGTDNY